MTFNRNSFTWCLIAVLATWLSTGSALGQQQLAPPPPGLQPVQPAAPPPTQAAAPAPQSEPPAAATSTPTSPGAAPAATPPPPPAQAPPPPPGTAAEATPPPPPSQPQPQAQACFPGCRSGFQCQAGQCVSSCNPACGPSQMCHQGQCYAQPAAAPAYPAYDYTPAPKVLPYRKGPPPPGYQLQESTLKWLWIPGIALMASGYVLAVSNLYSDRSEGDATVFIPIIGPFLAEGANDGEGALYGLAQGAGLVLTIVGLTVKRRRFVRDDLAFDVQIVPGERAHYGLTVSGTL